MNTAQSAHDRIDALLHQHPVVLFMKGTRQAPQCGFSAATIGVLNELLPDYHTVNVLADEEIRQGIKEYGNWPTIPQLYVKRELIGGADIVQSMHGAGQLHELSTRSGRVGHESLFFDGCFRLLTCSKIQIT